MKKIKELLVFIVTFIFMILSMYMIKNLFQLFGIIYTPDNYFLYTVFDFISSLLVIVLLVIFQRKNIKKDILELIKDHKKLFTLLVTIIVGYFLVVQIEVFCGIIENILFKLFNITRELSDNQQKIETIIHASPYLMVISTCLLAPLEEELLFRGQIRKTIKNKGVFIAVSGLFFGILHITDNYIFLLLLIIEGFIISSITELNEKKSKKVLLSVISVAVSAIVFFIAMTIVHGNLLNYFYSIDPKELITGITYVVLGTFFAGIYAKTDNIFYTVGLHTVVNTVATIVLLTR